MTVPFFNEKPTEPFVLPANAIPWRGFAPAHRGIQFERFLYERLWPGSVIPLGSTCWVSRCRRISLIERGMHKGFTDVQLDGVTIHERGFLFPATAAEFAVDAMLLVDDLAAIGPV